MPGPLGHLGASGRGGSRAGGQPAARGGSPDPRWDGGERSPEVSTR